MPYPRQNRTFAQRAPLHKNTVGPARIGHDKGGQTASYADVSADNRAPTRLFCIVKGKDRLIADTGHNNR